MERIESPPIRRAKILCARLRVSAKERTGLADAGTGLYFDETESIAHILEVSKDLSKNLAGALARNPIAS